MNACMEGDYGSGSGTGRFCRYFFDFSMSATASYVTLMLLARCSPLVCSPLPS